MKPEPRDIGPVPCDECAFQALQDNSAFYCVRRSPEMQQGRAQWPRIDRSAPPTIKGCGDGRRRKDNV